MTQISDTPEAVRTFLDAEQSRAVLLASRPFTEARDAVAAWQIGSTLVLFLLMLGFASWMGPSPYLLLLAPFGAGFFMRIFVFQHDLGHRSAFRSARVNDVLGTLLSLITSIPFEPWRTEHHWHHNHQGRLSKRGVDNMNSPMTLDEIPERPAEARYRIKKVRPLNIFLLGAHSLLIERRVPRGFFPFRESFKDAVHNREAMLRAIAWTLPAHLALHALVVLTLGWWVSVLVLVPSLVLGAGTGGVLFWIQHNFEHTYYAEDEEWHKANTAVYGSSYLKLGGVLRWFTADIGLHHVHHLNPRIPNYNLERARRAIPELAAVEPLSDEDLRRSFTHLFWDRDARRMRPAQGKLDG
ncbi:hypothetical protein FRC98_15670 [Lujinxingia vulgaris]|uniref:Fatty acid desaturase domain-containing protein n=1 Tax=Lujinxingia vulgaris TaxID=2600176 RepID=A0A5C6XA62_9DELT|nr:fatty acid desaturase [Lujinxingia vulgaris]TXD35643.1 hypothetical protein FRC98_15670 [Lujinxingia vulgaris]